MSTSLSILIVSYNTRALTLGCLDSLKGEPFDIIVVDNASSDGSADAIESEHPDVRLIRSQTNVGFARANNLAASKAVGEYLLLLNPDTVVTDGAIDAILQFAHAQPDAGVWGGRTLYPDGSLNPTSCWGFMTLRSVVFQLCGLTAAFPASEFFNPEPYGRWERDRERHVDIVTGCFLLIRRAFWERLGGFDPRFFMYAEEADLCIRAHLLGARPMLTPNATIIHYESASDPIRLEKVIKVLKGKTTLVRLHWGALRRTLGLNLLRVSPLVRSLCYALGHRICKRPEYGDRARLWREVWRRRSEWFNGYPPFARDHHDQPQEATLSCVS